MTLEEQMQKRKEFADKCNELAKFGESIPSGGWDAPMRYIVHSLQEWAKQYRKPIQSTL